MNKIILLNYIKRLTKQDIINFSLKQNINLTEEEINIIYYYIKNKYNDFFNGKEQILLSEIKTKVSPTTYNKILEYYELYKKNT